MPLWGSGQEPITTTTIAPWESYGPEQTTAPPPSDKEVEG